MKGISMQNVINVRGLTMDDLRVVEKMVDFLKEKTKSKPRTKAKTGAEKAEFKAWPLGVKGTLRRKDIYDYL
jgi:hypothetical protein